MGLFGGSAKQETKSKPYNPWVTDQWTKQMWGLSQQPFEMYPEQMYAEMDPLQREALGMQEDYARGLGGMIDPTMEAWRSTLSAPDVANNPYVQGMIEQQANVLNRNLAETMPNIQAGMLGVNERLGGSGQGVAEGIAIRGTQDALAEQMAKTQLAAYQQGLGQQRYGLSAAPGMASFGMTPANILGQVGATQRAEDQRAIDEDMARFNFAQEEPWRRLERFAGSYQPMTGQYGTTTTKGSSSPGILGAATQLGGLALGAMGMFGGGMGGGGGFMPMPSGFGAPMPAPMAAASPVGAGGFMSSTDPWSISSRWGSYNPMQMGF